MEYKSKDYSKRAPSRLQAGWVIEVPQNQLAKLAWEDGGRDESSYDDVMMREYPIAHAEILAVKKQGDWVVLGLQVDGRSDPTGHHFYIHHPVKVLKWSIEKEPRA